MSELIEQVRAAIDETERIARYAGGTGQWTVGECVDAADASTTEWLIMEDRYPHSRVRGNTRANHVARHDPAAVLRRCAADRAILDRIAHDANNLDLRANGEPRAGQEPLLGDELVRLLAHAYGIEVAA